MWCLDWISTSCPVSCEPFHNGNSDMSTGHSCPIRDLSLLCIPSMTRFRWLTARCDSFFSPHALETRLLPRIVFFIGEHFGTGA